MHLLIPLALGLLIQGFAWGFMDFETMVDILGNDGPFVHVYNNLYQCPMQSIKLYAVFLELAILPPREFNHFLHE